MCLVSVHRWRHGIGVQSCDSLDKLLDPDVVGLKGPADADAASLNALLEFEIVFLDVRNLSLVSFERFVGRAETVSMLGELVGVLREALRM